MDPEESSWRRRRARARGGHPRGVRGGGRGAATAVSRCCLRLLGLLLSSPGMLVLVVCYCFLGAFLFRFLETEDVVEPKVAVEKYREDCIKELWHITERLNVLYEKNWTALVNEQLYHFEMSVMSVTEAEVYDDSGQSGPQKQHQSFARALFYSITIMTTIGFGRFTPKSPTNKIVIMLFAVFGIPITMLCLAYVGTLLAHGLQTAYTTIVSGISPEILCPLNDNIECKSLPAQTPQSLEVGDVEEDLMEAAEAPYSSGNLDMGQRHKSKQIVKSNSIMLTTMNLALDDLGQNLTRSIGSERHSLLVECEECIMEQNASNYANKKASMEIGNPSSMECHFNLDEVSKAMKNSHERSSTECSKEERSNDQENCQMAKQWNSGHHDTPSRTPLIGKDETQSPHSLQHTFAEAKYLWDTSLPTRPPTPMPTRCSSRKGQCAKYDQDSSPLAGSDRHLCSTPSLAAVHLDFTTSKQVHLPAWLIFGVLGTYICVGAAIFASWEGWEFLDGAFFCFMLLSTVGFGDLVPGYSHKVWNSIQNSWKSGPETQVAALGGRLSHSWKLTSCCIYLLFGIVLVASSISLMHKKWASYIHALRKTLDKTGDEHLEEEEVGEEIGVHHDELREASFNQLFQ